jgi:general secretion pathway protein I
MTARADHSHPASGFTLIETIVALVILSAVTIVFYNFLSTSLNGARRVEQTAIAYDHHMNALELATAVNPMAMPAGTMKVGTYRIHWTSRLLGDIRQSSKYPAGRGVFKIALYRMTFDFPDSVDIAPIEVTRMGYHRDDVPDFSVTAK